MVDDNKERFTEILKAVYALYRVDISQGVMAIWWNSLKVYDLTAIEDALGRCSVNPDTGQFIPKPADVVKMIEGTTLDAAMVAWAKVDRAIGQVGTYATVIFDDALIHRVISDMGGWPAIGQKSTEEWPFVGKEFQTRYRGFKVNRATPQYPRKLIGLIDQQNAQHGYPEEIPIMLGDAKRAKLVHDRGANAMQLGVNLLEVST